MTRVITVAFIIIIIIIIFIPLIQQLFNIYIIIVCYSFTNLIRFCLTASIYKQTII